MNDMNVKTVNRAGQTAALDLTPRLRALQADTRSGVDQERVRHAVREILLAIGEDPEREGLRGTPDRVARAFTEMFAGLHDQPGRHLRTVFEHSGDELVMLRDITFSSVCEHHLLPFYGRVHIAYQPGSGQVVGLSKLARAVEGFARKPQLQERLTGEIADALMAEAGAAGATVIVEGEHMCMKLRGAKNPHATMRTVAHRGVFSADPDLRREVADALRQS